MGIHVDWTVVEREGAYARLTEFLGCALARTHNVVDVCCRPSLSKERDLQNVVGVLSEVGMGCQTLRQVASAGTLRWPGL